MKTNRRWIDRVRNDLIPWWSLGVVFDMLVSGAWSGSASANWRDMPDDARSRCLASALQHVSASMRGAKLDEHSRLPHLAHAVSELMIVLELEREADERSKRSRRFES
jgi:hypothetical protein